MAFIGELELLLPDTLTDVVRALVNKERSLVNMLEAPLSTIHLTLSWEAGVEVMLDVFDDDDDRAVEVMRLQQFGCSNSKGAEMKTFVMSLNQE